MSSPAPAFIQANTGGRLHDAAEPSVAPLDRGFLYGDAVYEVWRSYGRVVFAYDAHWERLGRSAEALLMPLPFGREEMWSEIRRTVAAYDARTGTRGERYIRLQVTRGAGAIGLDVRLADGCRWVILVQGLVSPDGPRLDAGVALAVSRRLRRNPPQALDPAWKTGNYLNNLLGLAEARARGADDVLFLNLAGLVTEASTANVFFVRGNRVVTPAADAGILHGVTRGLLLRAGRVAGVTVAEGEVREEDLPGFEECFLTSTTRDVMPVCRIDGTRYATGPETVTRRLRAAFAGIAEAEAARCPERRLDAEG